MAKKKPATSNNQQVLVLQEENNKLKEQLERLQLRVQEQQEALQSIKLTMWDLETSDLVGDYGRIICASFKQIGLPAVTFRIDDYPSFTEERRLWDDKQLCLDIRDYLAEQDMVFTWNGRQFDMKMLDTRLKFWREEKRKPILHSDVMYVAKYQLLLRTSKLDHVLDFLNLGIEKTRIKPHIWQMASGGHKPSMDYVVEHCEIDVDGLECVYLELKDMVNVIFKQR